MNVLWSALKTTRIPLFRAALWSPFAFVFYCLSYAPFLWAVTSAGSTSHFNPYYRSPAAYRLVDWCVVKTPARSALLSWADCFGVRGTTEMQAWYFAQGVSDTSGFHFNIQP